MASTISKKSTSSYAEKVQVFTKESEFSERDTSPLVIVYASLRIYVFFLFKVF